MKLHEIREARAAKVAELRNLTAGEMTAEKKTRFDAIKAEVVALEADEQRAQFLEEAERRSLAGHADKPLDKLESRISLVEAINCQIEQRSATGALAEYNQEHLRRTGKKATGIAVPHSIFEKRAAQTTTTADGIVPDDFRADQFVGLLRNALVVKSLGARVLGNLRGDVVIPRQATSSTAYWVAENEALTESGLTFDSITMGPKHVGAITELSRQLLQQANPSIEQLVRDDFVAVVSAAVDQALLHGDGLKQPEGIVTAATGTGSIGAVTADYWGKVLKVIEDLQAENISPNFWLASPQAATKLRSVLVTEGVPGWMLDDNGRVAGIPLVVSKHLQNKSGTPDTGRMILGDFSEMLIGTWGGVDVLANPYESTAYARGGVKVRIMTTMNMIPRRAEAFSVIDDLAI